MNGYSRPRHWSSSRFVILCACAAIIACISDVASAQMTSIAACRALVDKVARYACYDTLEQESTAPDRGTTAPKSPISPQSAKSVATTLGEGAGEATRRKPVISAVRSLSFDREGKFTVILDNGEIWHQFDADSGTAHFRKVGSNIVKITPVFWEAYDLQINDQNAVYRVERLR